MRFQPCCEWLENMLGYAGDQGMAVVARGDGVSPHLTVQCRPFRDWQLAALRALPIESGEALHQHNGQRSGLSIALYLPLRYCPSCGLRLDDLIARQQSAFVELCKAHEQWAL